MAKKNSMPYYNIDTDRYSDFRLRKLCRTFSCKGMAIYDYLLCEVYRNEGCYMPWGESTVFAVADYFGIKESAVREIVTYCGEVGLFDKGLLARGVLTSRSIQIRYTKACRRMRRKGNLIPDDIRLVTDKEVDDSETPADELPQTAPAESVSHGLTVDEEIRLMSAEEVWLDQLQVLHSISVEAIRSRFPGFRAQCIADGKTGHQNLADAKKHFNAWLRIAKNSNDNGRQQDERQPASKDMRAKGHIHAPGAKTYGDTF